MYVTATLPNQRRLILQRAVVPESNQRAVFPKNTPRVVVPRSTEVLLITDLEGSMEANNPIMMTVEVCTFLKKIEHLECIVCWNASVVFLFR